MLDDDSELGFSSPAYSITENFVTGSASITVTRSGSNLGIFCGVLTSKQAPMAPPRSRVDYLPGLQTLNFAPGEANKTFGIAIIDDTLDEG